MIIQNAYHELYSDLEKDEFYMKSLEWINKHRNIGKTDKRKFFVVLTLSDCFL